jgi:hypothetical protein
MKVADLVNMYDFHDSTIENVNVNDLSRRITMEITLCNWKQQNYNENEAELVDACIIFENVSEFEIEPIDSHFDGDEILLTQIITEQNEEKLKIIVYDGKDTKILNITAEKVNLFYGQS